MPDHVSFSPNFVLDDGFEQLTQAELLDEVSCFAGLTDIELIASYFDDMSTTASVVFDGIDTVTSIRYRHVWIVQFKDGAIERIIRASGFGRGSM